MLFGLKFQSVLSFKVRPNSFFTLLYPLPLDKLLEVPENETKSYSKHLLRFGDLLKIKKSPYFTYK